MAAQRAAEQVVHRFDQLIEFDALEVQWLTPGEGEQAVGQCRGAVGRGHRGVDETLGFIMAAGLDIALDQVEAADDPGQHVIEVVGDAAGQLAHRFHLLRLTQRFLRLFAAGHFLEQPFVDFGQRLGALRMRLSSVSLSSRRACSARQRSVTSRAMTKKPSTAPCASRRGR